MAFLRFGSRSILSLCQELDSFAVDLQRGLGIGGFPENFSIRKWITSSPRLCSGFPHILSGEGHSRRHW